MQEKTALQRWQQAQSAERIYWQQATVDSLELLRITHEKVGAVQWAQQTVAQIFDMEGPWVEIGIGPLGVGCIHLLPRSVSRSRELIGLDPLPRLEISETLISEPIEALVKACHSENYRHLTGMGENIELASRSAAVVICYNVLDHCHDPAKVLEEIQRILKPDGHLLLGCDIYSWAGLMKYRIHVATATARGIQLNSIGDVAHPHQFLAEDLENLVLAAGLEILATNDRPYEPIRRLWSRAHRMLIVARKKGNVG